MKFDDFVDNSFYKYQNNIMSYFVKARKVDGVRVREKWRWSD